MPDELKPLDPVEQAFRRLLVDLYVDQSLREVALQAYAELAKAKHSPAITEVLQRADRRLLNAVQVYELDPRAAEVVRQVIGDQGQRRSREVYPR
ncbi:hypothetical protein AB9U01_25185 [Pseudomonas qingdaonensis]|uniref:hypothetical protein n=1 Tax=Pseudomonas qingdaonensis TaxID=2056231 RepID=UPI0035153585